MLPINIRTLCFLLIILLSVSDARRPRRKKRKDKDIRGEVRGDITADTYRPNLSKVIPGASSLAFVFDVTGSMWDDLRQVREGAGQILNKTLQRQDKPLYNYVLVPFHDPGMLWCKILEYAIRKDFKRTIKSYYFIYFGWRYKTCALVRVAFNML